MRSLGLILVVLFFSGPFLAAVPPLEREISLDLRNEKITLAFAKIQEQAQVVFSYPPSVIQSIGPVNLKIAHKTVREVLLMLLPDNIVIKQKNNYIILKDNTAAKNSSNNKISGYVIDESTQKKVPNVTIYDKISLQSATTDQYGFYTLKVPINSDSVSVNKVAYADTIVAVDSLLSRKLVNISIRPQSFVQHLKDSMHLMDKLSEVNAFSKKMFQDVKAYVNTDNIKDTLERDFQISLLPFVGTNHRLSGVVNNKVSVNVLGGYARGLKGFEVGTLFNFEKENTKGVQLAGLFNFVGDSANGTQLAGLMNICGRSSRGFQGSVILNVVTGQQQGAQVAAVMNVDHRSRGLNIAGLMNVSGHANGTQLAVIGNVDDTLKGLSFAAGFNSAKHSEKASQVAVLFNRSAKGSTRLQLAALLNKAEHVSGTQIGFFNFADSASGVPIGVLSFVRTGLHQMEFSGDELFPVNIGLRTGVPAFYNILSAGTQNFQNNAYWQIGYGIGTSIKLNKKFRADLTGSVQHISRGSFYLYASELYRLYLGVEFFASKRFSLAGGPTLNYYVTDVLTPQYEQDFRYFTPKAYKESTDAYDFNRKSWLGFKLSLRLF